MTGATRRGWLAAALGLVAARAVAGPVGAIGEALFPEVVFAGPGDVPALALTIDDGPNPGTTPAILDALDAVGIKATFMLIGDHARAAPDLVRQIVARGHEIGSHMNRDEMTARLDDAALEAGMAGTVDFLRGFAPVRFVRPGWGVPTRRIVAAAARHDLTVVVGNVAPMDTSAPQRAVAEPWLELNAAPGAILTIHDGPDGRGEGAARLIAEFVPKVQAQGLRFVTLSELVPAG